MPVDNHVRSVCTACGKLLGGFRATCALTWRLHYPHACGRRISGKALGPVVPYYLCETATPGQRIALSVEKGHAPAVSYRDWGRGEGSPRERQPIAPWDDLGDPVPSASSAVDGPLPYAEPPTGGRAWPAGARRRLPASVGGRVGHRARRRSGSARRPGRRRGRRRPSGLRVGVGVRPGGGGRASGGSPGRSAAARESDHTREWTFDRPQEQGYVGQPAGRHRPGRAGLRCRPDGPPASVRVPSSRGGLVGRGRLRPAGGGRTRAAAPPTASRDTDDSWARPADRPGEPPGGRSVEPSAEPEPEYRPAVDPWDASGVHTWRAGRRRPAGRPGGASRWEQSDGTGQWDRFTDTAQWDRTDVGRWGPVTADRDEAGRRDTGGFDRRDRDRHRAGTGMTPTGGTGTRSTAGTGRGRPVGTVGATSVASR